MIITAITQQVRQTKRFSVFLDGVYGFSLSEAALLESGITRGQELSPADIHRLKQLSEDDLAYGRALRYLAMRPHSEWELREYLRRKNVSPSSVDVICEKLQRIGLLDDKSFAQSWVHSRRALKATSRRKLASELQQKHIAGHVIDEVLAEDRQETDELQVLRQLIERKRARYPDQQKLIAYLARQGYAYSDIKLALTDTEQ